MAKKSGSGERVFFTEGDQALPIPDLTAHQKDSWADFVKNGLREVFDELNPIDDYTGQKLSLRFKDYYFKAPKETEQEAKYNLATYEAPLHVLVEPAFTIAFLKAGSASHSVVAIKRVPI